MITSKQITQISEEWLASVVSDYSSLPTDIYKNPGSSDIKELYKKSSRHEVRFIADSKTNIVYVWNADTALHQTVAKKLGLLDRLSYDKPWAKSNADILIGNEIIDNGLITMSDSNELGPIISVASRQDYKNSESVKYMKRLVSKNWSWLSKYINYSSYFNRIKISLGN
jgi:hypothetical protein